MPADDSASRRLQLIDQILHLPSNELMRLEEILGCSGPQFTQTNSKRDWPHAPIHRVSESGTYIVTAATYEKAHLFRGPERVAYLEQELLSAGKESRWQLEAWAVFSNHYHFVGHASSESEKLPSFIKNLHGRTARHINQLDGVTERQVWFNYWDTQITFERSYFARLNYVHQNAVRHGLVRLAHEYPWCSAAWFQRTATPAQVRTIYAFSTDRLSIQDDFDPV